MISSSPSNCNAGRDTVAPIDDAEQKVTNMKVLAVAEKSKNHQQESEFIKIWDYFVLSSPVYISDY